MGFILIICRSNKVLPSGMQKNNNYSGYINNELVITIGIGNTIELGFVILYRSKTDLAKLLWGMSEMMVDKRMHDIVDVDKRKRIKKNYVVILELICLALQENRTRKYRFVKSWNNVGNL